MTVERAPLARKTLFIIFVDRMFTTFIRRAFTTLCDATREIYVIA